MSFWTYMLHCNGGFLYAGHTDDLERRVGAHETGAIPGFTRDHLPVKYIWSEEFASREEALAMERRVKGWSRAKKLALVRGDWDEVVTLANEKKDSPSTGSGRTGVRGTAVLSSGRTGVRGTSALSSGRAGVMYV